MMQMKMGGLVLTGIGAYLIINKGIQMVNRAVDKFTEAQKWKAYYKACAENRDDVKKILPPHYEQTYRYPNGDTEKIAPEGESEQPDPEAQAKKEASQKAVIGAVKDTIDKVVDGLFDAREAGKKGLNEIDRVDSAYEDEVGEEKPVHESRCYVPGEGLRINMSRSAPETPATMVEDEESID